MPTVQQLILDQLKEIKGDLSSFRSDLSAEICAIRDDLTAFKLAHTKDHADLDTRTRSAHERLDEHSRQLDSFNRQLSAINKLLPFLRVVAYLMTSLSMVLILALLGFLWSLLTNQVTIVQASWVRLLL